MAAKLALLVLLAVVAAASAHGGWGYNGWGYAPYRHHHRGYFYDGAPAVHPGGAISSVSRSTQGIGKRSADAEPEADAEAHHGYGYNRWGYAPWGYASYYPAATSYEYRSPQGLGKRSADAEPEADAHHGHGYGYNRYGWAPYNHYSAYSFPGASVYEHRLNKRSAEPGWWGGASSYQTVNRALPWGGVSSYSVNDNVWNARVSEHSRTPFSAYGYGFHN